MTNKLCTTYTRTLKAGKEVRTRQTVWQNGEVSYHKVVGKISNRPVAIPARRRTLNLDMGKVAAAAAVQGQISARIKERNAADKLNGR